MVKNNEMYRIALIARHKK